MFGANCNKVPILIYPKQSSNEKISYEMLKRFKLIIV